MSRVLPFWEAKLIAAHRGSSTEICSSPAVELLSVHEFKSTEMGRGGEGIYCFRIYDDRDPFFLSFYNAFTLELMHLTLTFNTNEKKLIIK